MVNDADKVCKSLNTNDKIVLYHFSGNNDNKFGVKFEELDNDVISKSERKLLSLGLITLNNIVRYSYKLTDLGSNYLKLGLPEIRLANLLSKSDLSYSEALSRFNMDKNELNAAIGVLKRFKLIDISNHKIHLIGDPSILSIRTDLILNVNKSLDLKGFENNLIDEFIKRGIIEKSIIENTDGKLTDFGKSVVNSPYFFQIAIDKLTPEMIIDWNNLGKDKIFMSYDLNAQNPIPIFGRKNVVKNFIKLIRDTFLSMGFIEMRGPYVESTFWNFDVMLFRQNHPDRDIQDTFYIYGDKAKLPEDFLESVSRVYEEGFDYGKFNKSFGYGIKFDKSEAYKLILRGHSTATSFRYIYNIISKNKDKPARYFSIDKVFRNETLDSTHLAEFRQVEGLIYDDDLTAKDLIKYLKEFYARIGINNIRVKPTYNPYTEPSFEIQGFFDKLNRWVEIGNSGIFRPEVLSSFGIKKNVLGFGLALERSIALRLNLDDIRVIYGPFADLDFFRNISERTIYEGILW